MKNKQHLFLELAVIKQLSYDEISKELSLDRKILTSWWDTLKEEREKLSEL